MAESAPAASASPLELRARYNEAFRAWLAHRDERELGTAYALGREAVQRAAERARPRRGAPQGRAGGAARRGRPGRAAPSCSRPRACSSARRCRRSRSPTAATTRSRRSRGSSTSTSSSCSALARRVGGDQRDDDDRGDAAAHRRCGARRCSRAAPRDDLEHRRRSVRAPAAAPPRRTAGRRAARWAPPIGVLLRSAGRPLGTLEVADRPRARVHPARRGDPRPARPARLGRDRQVAGLHARAPHRPGAAALAAAAAACRPWPGSPRPCASSPPARGSRSAATSTTSSARARRRVAALIGDVCGKGPEAASVTALARHTLRAAAAYEARPSAVLALLHRALREARDDGRFCTVAYCDFDVRRDGARMLLCLRRASAAAGAARATARVEPVGELGTLLGADVEPRAHRRRHRARAGRPGRALHRRRHRGPAPAARSCSATATSPSCCARCAGLPADSVAAARPGRRARRRRTGGRATTSRSWSSAPAAARRRGAWHTPRRSSTHGGNGWLNLRAERPETARPRPTPAPRCCASSSRTCARTARSLREEWARRITEAQLLTALTPEEIFSEATSVYDNYVEVLETGSRRGAAGLRPQPVRAHHPARRRDRRGARHRAAAARRARPLAVREVPGRLRRCSTACSTPTSRRPTGSPTRSAINFVQERERVIRQQQEAIRELSTPVLQVRERLLILPIIGVLDSQRARQLPSSCCAASAPTAPRSS